MAYPSTLDSLTTPAGTSLLTSPDHAGLHGSVNTAIASIETTVGTTAGTNVLKNFAAGDFPARINVSNVLQQVIAGGTLNNTTQGTPRITGGTASAFILGTSNVIGGTVANAVVGTSQVQGGTVANSIIGTSQVQGGTVANASIGTPTILGGTIAASGTVTPFNFGAALAPTVITLTDAVGAIAVNAQAGQVFHLVMGTTAGNRTVSAPSNATEGQVIRFRIKQNTNNTGTILWNAIFRQNSSGAVALGTQSTYNYYAWGYNSVDTKWDSLGNSGGII